MALPKLKSATAWSFLMPLKCPDKFSGLNEDSMRLNAVMPHNFLLFGVFHVQNIDVKFLHDAQDYTQAFHKPIDSNPQHAICSRLIFRP